MDKCSLCGNDIPDGPDQHWTGPEGEKLSTGTTAQPSAVAETSVGELTICERCLAALPSYLLPEDVYEIYYQFGLDYRDREMHERSADVLCKALSFQKTADVLAALAYEQDQLGHRDEAIRLYEEALQIEPEHFMSKENLKLIRKKPTTSSSVRCEPRR
jgi:tetratricopeptide (TPR) repeat protein